MNLFKTGAGCVLFCFFSFVHLSAVAAAAELRAARVTQIINDVKLLPGQAAARAAVVNDSVDAGTAVRTGADSRSELTFLDLTITRLGANTIFSFNEGARQINLGGGAVLLQVPRNGAEAKIATVAVTAAITGGTALLESNKGFPTKLLMLEGIGRFYPTGHPEQAAIVHGGEMAMMTVDGQIMRPTKFNAALVYKTSKLITSFPTLPNADLILAVIDEQQAGQLGQSLSPSSSPTAKTLVDVISQATSASATPPPSAAPAPSATPPPTKFGPPSAITSPNPYVINAGTTINTDPTITTNGVTNFGKIYRDLSQDGPFAVWLGSSPRPFDTAFGDNFQPDNHNQVNLPIPIFIFSSLRLDGDPKVSNSSNFPTLGLGSLGGITSSPSGAVFTFGGIDQVALVALNGSIDLSGISFANFGRLYIYARGTGSDLTLAAPISNLRRVQLNAEHNITVSAPVTVNDTVTNQTGFRARAGNDIQISSTVKANQMEISSLGSIHINSSAQLLAMINSAGTHGQVVILATGSNGTVDVGGQIQAEQGEVDIRQTGDTGQTTLNNASIHGDVVKISALGANGVLNIGSGNVLNADTVLKLYAVGSNGTLNFLSNVTLSSPSNILAANTINISQGVVVTINSAQQADVFTNHPNYFGFGGTGSEATTGTFGGAGAKNPQSLSSAPPLGGPGQGP
jgi:hypothetical protein